MSHATKKTGLDVPRDVNTHFFLTVDVCIYSNNLLLCVEYKKNQITDMTLESKVKVKYKT